MTIKTTASEVVFTYITVSPTNYVTNTRLMRSGRELRLNYVNPVRAVFNTMPAPRPVVAHLVHYKEVPEDINNGVEGNPEFWTVRIYRDNLRTFSGEDQQAIGFWLFDVIKTVRQTTGAEIYHEVFERMP
jgi:hypothetical protein